MKRFSGFRMGGSAPFLGKAGLDQTAAFSESEPDLNSALRTLSAPEVEEVHSWGPVEKALFLKGYQFLAVATAKNMTRPDGTPFNGFFPDGVVQALAILSASANYLLDFPPELVQAGKEMTDVVADANGKTLPGAQGVVSKYRLLRDRVAWEMANSGVTVQFDIVGTDPGNPGVLYQRTIGENRAPDLALVYSSLSPAEMMEAGRDLEKKYADLGISFELAGPSMGASALPILGIVIAAIAGIIAFFALFWNHQDRAKFDQATIDAVTNNPNLTAAERAEILTKIRQAESFFGQLFGSFPWTALLVTGAIALVAIFGIPAWIESSTKMKALK